MPFLFTTLLSFVIIVSSLISSLNTQPPPPRSPLSCYYQQIQCIRAPCPPILVCPSPPPTFALECTTVTDCPFPPCVQGGYCPIPVCQAGLCLYPTCTPRPLCLDASPPCLLPETSDMCPPALPLPTRQPDTSSSPPPATSKCKIGGCSGELCLDSNTPDVVSICLYRPESVCYTSARCEVQPNGHCAWTSTSEFQACLSQYP